MNTGDEKTRNLNLKMSHYCYNQLNADVLNWPLKSDDPEKTLEEP